MDLTSDYYTYRAFEDRAAELRREADAFRLTRVLADQHAALFPRARRFAAGLTAVATPRRAERSTRYNLQPCGC